MLTQPPVMMKEVAKTGELEWVVGLDSGGSCCLVELYTMSVITWL